MAGTEKQRLSLLAPAVLRPLHAADPSFGPCRAGRRAATLAEAMTTQSHAAPEYSRRWFILALVALAQLTVVLDTTVVNIALPSAQNALHFSDGDRQWIVTAYALAFGSLLPLGGRIGDLFDRKRTLVAGLVGFAAVSAISGLAQNFDWLLAARALRGPA